MISLHVIVDGCPPERLDRALLYLMRTQQTAVCIGGGAQLDRTMQFIERVRIAMPKIVIMMRILEDTGILLKLTPNEWYNRYITPRMKWLQDNKIVLVVDNESSGDDATIKEYVARSITVANMLHAAKLNGAFCRFATGNIVENQYQYLKPLLEILNDGDWVSNNEYSNSPGKSSSGHLERYKRILNVVPGKHFNVAIGECGILKDYQAREGYTSIPISGAEAANQLLADEVWYEGGSIPRFWFVIGGYQDWQHVQVGDDALAALEDYYSKNPISPVTPPPSGGGTTPTPLPPYTVGAQYVITTPGEYVNVRQVPSTNGAILGTIPNQAVVTVFEEQLVNGVDRKSVV